MTGVFFFCRKLYNYFTLQDLIDCYMKTCNQFNVMIWVTVSYIKWDVFVVIGQIHLVFGVLFYRTTGGRFIFTDINVLLVFKTPGHQVWGGTKWGNESLCCTSVSPKGNYCVPCSLAESQRVSDALRHLLNLLSSRLSVKISQAPSFSSIFCKEPLWREKTLLMAQWWINERGTDTVISIYLSLSIYHYKV